MGKGAVPNEITFLLFQHPAAQLPEGNAHANEALKPNQNSPKCHVERRHDARGRKLSSNWSCLSKPLIENEDSPHIARGSFLYVEGVWQEPNYSSLRTSPTACFALWSTWKCSLVFAVKREREREDPSRKSTARHWISSRRFRLFTASCFFYLRVLGLGRAIREGFVRHAYVAVL